MTNFLIRSLVLSAILTILLNVFLAWRARRLADDRFDRSAPRLDEPQPTVEENHELVGRPRVQVLVPWKAMLIASIGLTVALNLIAWLAR